MTGEERNLAAEVNQAIRANDIGVLATIFREYPEIKTYESAVGPWLCAAARRNRPLVVKWLLDQGTDINSRKENTQQSALCLAVYGQASEVIDLLLERGAELDRTSIECDPLIAAVQENDLEIARKLLKHGADPHFTYALDLGETRSPLSYAEELGFIEMAQLLREHGGEVAAATLLPTREEQRKRLLEAICTGLGNANQEVIDQFTSEGGDLTVTIELLSPSSTFPFHTLVTNGLCEINCYTPEFSQRRTRLELMIHLPFTWSLTEQRYQQPRYTWPIQWLKDLVAGIVDGDIILRSPQSIISNDDPPQPLGEGTEQTCWLVLADLAEYSPIAIDPIGDVHLCTLLPIYTEERDFEKQHGIAALVEKFALSRVPPIVQPTRERLV
ncbi:Ankyrin repeats (3 copies) [Bremerella volcania]|uniref:Ankyrin repeats (3 copies) n=1 Tax=Bremerella volcania TaxID=2527984 RepID=A0A518C8X8_9BACT|nr:suppressor of fused domain protein [Bremerella volcania]QDU75685.1 Ankyrin repeats (3 copies) [Bremerella volcania]